MFKYNSYKDCNIHWVGKIPLQWEVKQNKHIFFEEKDEVGVDWNSYQLLSLSKQGVIKRDIESGKGKFPESFENYKIVTKNSLIFCLYDIEETPRSVGLSNFDGMITGSYKIYKTNQNPNFIYYWYLTIDDFKGLKPYYTGLRNVVRPETFLSLKIPLPSISEQHQIVQYLDEKTELVDKLISTKEKKITLLKEQRTSLINQVVTKGLNPNVKMKDSGVEWIGEIPVNWKKVSLRYLGNLYGGLTGKSGEDFKNEDNPKNKPYIPYTNIYNNTYISKNHFHFVTIEDGENQNRVQKFDLFFLMSSETYQDLGKSCILIDDVDELYLNSFCKGFRVNDNGVSPLFLNYQLSSQIVKELISIKGNGFTRINLRQDRLLETPCFIPPIDEQIKIVEYLDNKTKEIDGLVSLEQRKIDTLKEYRQSLISEVVTGKIKVTID